MYDYVTRPRRLWLEKCLLAVVTCVMAFFALGGVAGAQVTENSGDQLHTFVSVDQWVVLLGLVIPFVTALIKRYGAPDWVSTIITGALAAIVAFTVEGLQAGDLTFDRWANSAGVAFVTALVSWLATSDPVSWLNRRFPGGITVGSRVTTIEPTPPRTVDGGSGGA